MIVYTQVINATIHYRSFTRKYYTYDEITFKNPEKETIEHYKSFSPYRALAHMVARCIIVIYAKIVMKLPHEPRARALNASSTIDCETRRDEEKKHRSNGFCDSLPHSDPIPAPCFTIGPKRTAPRDINTQQS